MPISLESIFGSLILLTWTTPADIGFVGVVLTKEMQNHVEIVLMQIYTLIIMRQLDRTISNLTASLFITTNFKYFSSFTFEDTS